MDNIAVTAIMSGAFSLLAATATAILTYLLTQRREREGDWRKLKVECYREYTLALSGIMEGRSDLREARPRHADAVNSMLLVASSEVLKNLDAYTEENWLPGPARDRERHDALLTVLFKSMRFHIKSSSRQPDDGLRFRLIAPPSAASSSTSP